MPPDELPDRRGDEGPLIERRRSMPASRPPLDPNLVDEARAVAARQRLHEQGIIPIEPCERVATMLDPDEVLVAVRLSTPLDRRGSDHRLGAGVLGDLYVTTRRLIHLGGRSISYPIDQIREAAVLGGELRLIFRDGQGVAIGVDDPAVLRVDVAAARSAARMADCRARGRHTARKPASLSEE